MQTMVRVLVATTLVLGGSGCAKTDWIDRTLVTVDVTGTWSGTMMAAGSGGAGGVRDVVFELEERIDGQGNNASYSARNGARYP